MVILGKHRVVTLIAYSERSLEGNTKRDSKIAISGNTREELELMKLFPSYVLKLMKVGWPRHKLDSTH